MEIYRSRVGTREGPFIYETRGRREGIMPRERRCKGKCSCGQELHGARTLEE